MPGRADRSSGALSVLLLCDNQRAQAPNVSEHIRAFTRFARHHVQLFNPRGIERSRFLRLSDYDVLVVHYTAAFYLSEWFAEQMAGFDGLKVLFLQDEYRQVDAMAAWMRRVGIQLLFSSVPADEASAVYGSRLPGVDIVPTLTGYVPAELEGHRPQRLEDRALDVAYRGRSIPYWLGRLGQEKALIGREFLRRAGSTELRCDISWAEHDRIYGEAWYGFLASSRTTLGTESGASIVDFDGSLQTRTEEYLRTHPTATFDDVEREILAPFEGKALVRAVSPRVFEAAALGTAMVNFPGRYSDVIEPWVHYIPLAKDFSNFDEVVSAVRDRALLERLVAGAHSDLVASGRYSLEAFVRGFEREIEARVRPAERRPRTRRGGRLSRRMLALEHLRSPLRVSESALIASIRARATERVARRLIRRFPEIAALATRDPNDRLVRDLVRLAAATAAHLRELRYLGPPFDVDVRLVDDDRRLMLVGMPDPREDSAGAAVLRSRVASAITEGRLEEIVWDNSAVRESLQFPSPALPSLEIGYHVVAGAHRFTALEELGARDPDALIAALEPLFRTRPEEPIHELDRRALRVLRTVATAWAARSDAS